MRKHLVLVGAGHAHMTVLKNLADFTAAGHRVTVIGPGPLHYYSGMGPGMLSGIYRPEEIRFNVKDMAISRGAAFIEDLVVRVDPAGKELLLQQGQRVAYDVVSFNAGSGVPIDDRISAHEAVVPVKPIEELLGGRKRVIDALKQRKLSIVVAGGGPAGLEIAANLRRLVADATGAAEITLIAGDRLLAGFNPVVRRKALRGLARLGIALIEGQKVASADARCIRTTSGDRRPCDFLFMAVGVKPSPVFRDSGLPTGVDGGLLVNDFLQSVAFPEIFGGGDCICFAPRPLAKVGVYAVRQNPVLLQNLRSALCGGDLVAFTPQKRYLLAFNMGDGTAIVSWKRLVFDGRPGFALKDYLDRRFMKMFQG
ncbi:MAG: FAD-dependent oxidoreductase [Deltaproteobacteria bacterium]|nr:FAD-dependent oxidoreductase [Deltaproteobacteria bacterium]